MPTRMYFEYTGNVPVMKPHLHGSWDGLGPGLSSWKPGNMLTNKGFTFYNNSWQSPLSVAWNSNSMMLERQYWSPSLSGNQVINGTINAMQIMASEGAGTDNVDRVVVGILLCNMTGGVKQVLLEPKDYGPKTEYSTRL